MAQLIEELLGRREGSTVDFKRDGSSPKGIVKCFAALCNTAGGSILIGVDDDRNVVGLDDPQATEEAIAKAIYDGTEPRQSPLISVMTQGDREVVLVEAQYFQGAEPLMLREGGELTAYERVGSNSMPVDEERLAQILRERRGRAGFDQLPVKGATRGDLDEEAIAEAFAARGIEIDDDAKLESYEIVVRQNNELVPTVAGILLFGADPTRFLPDAYFRGIRYPGADKSGDALDSAEWRGLSLLRAIEEVEHFVVRNTGTAQTIPGQRRRDIPHYEPSLLREILNNAAAHADYSRRGQHLNVSIFSDHLVVDSPGKMPSGMSVEHLEAGVSVARNRAIMNILHALGYVEKHGTAYAKAVAASEQGYPIPEWSEPGPILRVALKPHPQATPDQVKRERRDRRPEIIALLEGGEKSPKELALAMGNISPRQLRRILQALQREGRIAPNDAAARSPKRKYRLTEDVDPN